MTLVNTGESLAEGGKREVREETGLDVSVGDPVATVEAIYKGNLQLDYARREDIDTN